MPLAVRTMATRLALALVTLLMFVPVAALAAECSGYDALVNQTTETFEAAKGHSVTVWRAASILVTDDPTSKYNLTTGECIGTVLTMPDGATSAAGRCARRDKAGDSYSLEWAQAPRAKRGSWKGLAGTGKFAANTENSGWSEFVVADGKMIVVKWGGVCQ